MSGSSSLNRFNPLVLAISLVIASTAYADQSSEVQTLPVITVTAETDGKDSYIVKETNTALPFAASVREIPQSVSVVTQQQIEDQGLTSLIDLGGSVTGIQANRFETNRASLNARGFTINNYQYDGVPTSFTQQWASGEVYSSSALLERYEVVRGSTGLLTGPGNPSAAINMIRKRATSKTPKANLEVSGGSWDNYRVMGDIANSLNDSGSIRGRAVAEYSDRGSYIDLHSEDILTVLLAGEVDITEKTTLSTGISYQNNEVKGLMWGGLPFLFTDGSRTNWDRSKTTATDWTWREIDYTNYFADVTHQFNNNWSAKLSYSHGERESNSHLMYLYNYPNKSTGVGLAYYGSAYNVTTEQDDISLTLNGKFNLFEREHELGFGVVNSRQDFVANYGSELSSPVAGNFYEWDGSLTQPKYADMAYSTDSNSTENTAVYGVARFELLDPLKLVLGGRVTTFERKAIKYSNQFTPYAGLIYDLNPNVSVYASYTSIFEPQDKKTQSGSYLDPQEGTTTEIGIKTSFLDDQLNASLSVFKAKQDNFAVEAGEHIVNGTNQKYYRGIDGAESEGFEIETSGKITPNWNILVGYAQFELKDGYGAKIDNHIPRKTANLFTTYNFSGALSALTLGAGATWQDDSFITLDSPVANAPSIKIQQDAFALVNLMAKYQISPEFSAQLNIDNVTDEKYYNGTSQQTWQAPRNTTLTFRYKF